MAVIVPIKLAAPPLPPSNVPKAGETIAQQAAAAGVPHGAGAGHGAPKKVASALGVQKYHAPIGALIIPHVHYVKGQPSHWIPNVSEQKWIENQWKDKDKAAEAAKKAVAAGTHHWVHVGQKTYAVANGLDVHVPKNTDTDDRVTVKNAPKVIVKHGAKPEHVTLHPNPASQFTPYPHGDAEQDQLAKDWKKLPPHESKKSVTFAGKHAAWVPSDWKIYKAEMAEDKLAGKWAKDPQGNWHLIIKTGDIEDHPGGNPELWHKSGAIKPESDEDHLPPHPEHVAPQGSKGPEPVKADVGGVAVSKEEIQDALAKLQGSQSTQIKGLLKGHPLEASDYHSVYKGELEKFPELKVPPGTKKAHVPEAKNAYIHHLTGKLAEIAQTEAEQDAAQKAAAAAQAQAAHAQELTPHEHVMGAVPKAKPPEHVPIKVAVGSMPATEQEIKQAVDLLQQSKSTAVKQPLQKAGNPLWQMDYHAINKQMLAQHPELTVAKGTKQAHVGQVKTSVLKYLEDKLAEFKQGGQPVSKEQVQEALQLLDQGTDTLSVIGAKLVKAGNPLGEVSLYGLAKQYKKDHPNTTAGMSLNELLTAYLKEHYGDMAAADQATGHDQAAQVHDLLANGSVKTGWSNSAEGAIAMAMADAQAKNKTYYSSLTSSPGVWGIGTVPPYGKAYYAATPEHKVVVNLTSGESWEWSVGKVADVVQKWVKKTAPGQAQAEAGPPPPALPAQVSPAEWAKNPEWPEIDKLVKKATSEASKLPNDPKSALAKALWITGKLHTDRWLYSDSSGNWVLGKHQPVTGTWGAETAFGYYHITKDHQIIHVAKDGTETALHAEIVLKYAQLLKQAEEKPPSVVPQEKPPGVPVVINGKTVFTAPAGTTLWLLSSDPAKYSSAKVYMKYPDGSWHFVSVKQSGQAVLASETLNNLVADGTMLPYDAGAKALAEAAQAPKVSVEPPPDSPPDAGPSDDVKFKVKESEFSVPAGSKVYWMPPSWAVPTAAAEAKALKYVKEPDGSWHKYDVGVSLVSSTNYDNFVTSGNLLEVGKAKPAEQAVPSKESFALIYDGEVVGEAPAGSQLYKDIGGFGKLWVKQPDGTWGKVGYGGLTTGYGNLDKAVEDGKMIPAEVPTAAQTAQAKELGSLKQLLKTGAVAEEDKTKSWGSALAFELAKNYKFDPIMIGQNQYGKWVSSPGDKDYYTFSSKTFQGKHHIVPKPGHPDKTEEPVPFAQVKAAIEQYVQPGSVLIGGKVIKHGFWYNPKGKAYLEVKAGSTGSPWKSGDAGKAAYIWHGADGSAKSVTVAFAEKQLEKNTEWHAQPKEIASGPGPVKPFTVSHATVLGEGDWHLWSSTSENGVSAEFVHVYGDGSVSYGTTTLAQESLDALLKAGTVLDQYGTTVVKPGLQPAAYHIWGSKPVTVQDLTDLLSQLEADTGTPGSAWVGHFMTFMGGEAGFVKIKKLVQAFMQAHGALVGSDQLEAVKALVRELLLAPEQKAAKMAEPVFLKSMPEGINSAKDVFTFTDKGYAEPKVGITKDELWGLTKPQLAAKIKTISGAFGDGKVVGTHLSGLSALEHVGWLTAWQAGDMAAVFALDAKGGKVSPAHPGAPKNADTHKITWSPLDPGQIPASVTIEGNWTPADITMPPAEVDNYLIKAGLQHAEYLTKTEKSQFVTAHRGHDQEVVDKLTEIAQSRFAGGGTPNTDPLKWTDGLVPAKAYDAYLAENSAASGWSQAALKAFAKDFHDELLPYAQKIVSDPAQAQDLLGDYYSQKQVIQKWLDAKHEQYIAEQSTPVWTQTPGAHPPKATHPIYQLTKTIPLTHDVSQWYFKPTAAGKKYIANQEHAAAQLGQLWGFRTPGSELITFDGKYGQAQKILPAVGDLSYGKPLGFYDEAPIPWREFTQRQVSDIAREHVFDWAIDNNDGRASNFLRLPDGSIAGIDKGRAWADWGTWKGLDGGKGADTQSRQISGQLYDAIRSHAISKDVADQAYIDVIQKARKMAKLPDDRLRTILEQAFAGRTKWGSLGKDQVIAAAVDRKNNLEKDFAGLWAKVYQAAGWTLPEVPEAKLGETPAGVPLHSGFSEPDFMDHVAAAKSFGAAAFFGGPDVEYGHALVWREFAGEGTSKPVIRGKMGARGQGLKNLIAWAKAHLAPGSNEGEPSASPAETQTVYSSSAGLPGKPPPNSPDRGQLTGERQHYENIVLAARTVSKHAVDKQFNTVVMDLLAATKAKLEGTLTGMEAISPDNEWRKNAEPVVKLYLGYIAQVEQAKETGGTFKTGDLPRYYAPPPEAKKPEAPTVSSPVKVELAEPSRPAGHLGPDGELHTVGGGSIDYADNRKVYRITLPDGEVIELFAAGGGPKVHSSMPGHMKDDGWSSGSGSALAHWGHIRFRAKAEDGAASLERIRAQLQEMGLPLEEATAEDMELYYWRHLYNVLLDRADGPNGSYYDPSSKYAKVVNAVNAARKQHGITGPLERAGLDPQSELAIWRDAWANLTSADQVAKFVETGGHLPHFGHYSLHSPGTAGGAPVWHRFDVTREFLAKQGMPDHQFFSGNLDRAMQVVQSGGQYAKDFRFDHLAASISSQANPADTGSTGFVFANLNSEAGSHVLANPAVLARTTTYGWSGDGYGDVAYRVGSGPHKAYFDPAKAAQWHGMETMFPGAWTLLDDIELIKAPSPSNRQGILDYLHKLGITEIRGLPVKDRIATDSTWTTARAKIREHWKAHPELLDPHAVPEFTPQALPTEAGAKAAESGQAAAAAAQPEWQALPSGKVWNSGDDQIVKTQDGYDLWQSGSFKGTYQSLDEAKAANVPAAKAGFMFYGKQYPAGTKVYKWTGGGGGRVVHKTDGTWWMVFPDGSEKSLDQALVFSMQKSEGLEEITPGLSAQLSAVPQTWQQGMAEMAEHIKAIVGSFNVMAGTTGTSNVVELSGSSQPVTSATFEAIGLP